MNPRFTRPEAYLERRRPPPRASNDRRRAGVGEDRAGDRNAADADYAAALDFATLLIVGILSFAAGALTLAALAFVLVHWR